MSQCVLSILQPCSCFCYCRFVSFFLFLQTRRKIKKERKRKEENVYNYKLVIVGQTSEWAQNGQINKMLEWSTGMILGQWP